MAKSVFVCIISIITIVTLTLLLHLLELSWSTSITFGIFFAYLMILNCFCQKQKPRKLKIGELIFGVFLLILFIFPFVQDQINWPQYDLGPVLNWPLALVAILLILKQKQSTKNKP